MADKTAQEPTTNKEESKEPNKRFVVEEVQESAEPEQTMPPTTHPPTPTEHQHIHAHTAHAMPNLGNNPQNQQTSGFANDFAPPGKKGSLVKKIIMIILTVGILGGAVAGGFYVFNNFVANQAEPLVQEMEPEPTEIPTPTPTPEPIVLSEYKAQVLNGSGTPGEAGKVSTLLENAGFEDIAAANANSFDYTDTEVRLKDGTPEGVFEEIEKALSAYVVVKGAPLAETSPYDVIVTVGSTKSPE